MSDRRGAGGRRLGHMLRAFRHRNYRLFFIGQGTSLIGTWINRVAMSWLVYRLTGSAALLGFVGFAGQIPSFFLGPFAGVWVDRLDRYRVLLATQAAAMLQSSVLALLALSGAIEVWHIVVLALVQGVINAFDTPARQSFVVEMVEGPEDLPNAIALNSSMFNAARLIGPSVAGILVAMVGEGWCFAIDALSYVAVIGSLLAMKLVRRSLPERGKQVLEELREGFVYAFGLPPLRAILLLLALVSFTGLPYVVLMPVMAGEVLGGGANTLGWLMSAAGVGALTAALFLAARRGVLGLGRLVPIAATTFGLGLCAFSLSRSLPLSLLCLTLVGAGWMIQSASSNTILQTLVREEMRGRVMAFYGMAILGTTPFGSLAEGALAARIGVPWTLFLGGSICVLGALVFARSLPRLRAAALPIYVERGIVVPEIATGLAEATALRNELQE
ncbi:MAG TPA: MFS transporter [Longimicrobiaceae bacterium]